MVVINSKLALAILAFCASVSAIPVENKRTTVGKFPVKLVVKPGATAKDFVNADRTRQKSFSKAAASVGEAPATNEVVSYIAVTTVGDQSFDLIVDTGSSNTWVGAGTKYKASSTSTDTGDSVSVTYGSGEFSGTEYTDDVTLGGLTATGQGVGVASSSSGFDGVDGIIGFGPEDLTEDTVSNVDEVPTFLQTLYSQGSISEIVLGVSFAPESGSDTDDTNGELTLGGTDSTKYTGSLTYTPVTSTYPYDYYWGITVTEIAYSSTSISSSAPAIVDTGTTLIYIPTSAYDKFLSDAGGKTSESEGLAYFTKEPTGDVTFTIGGTGFVLTPSQYIIPSAQAEVLGLSTSDYWSWIADGGSETDDVNFIIGQKFLENFYAVFDTTNSQVGFAPRA